MKAVPNNAGTGDYVPLTAENYVPTSDLSILNSPFLWIFATCWFAAFLVVHSLMKKKECYAAEHLRTLGIKDLTSFKKPAANPRVVLAKIWAGFFFGSQAAAIISLMYWLLR